MPCAATGRLSCPGSGCSISVCVRWSASCWRWVLCLRLPFCFVRGCHVLTLASTRPRRQFWAVLESNEKDVVSEGPSIAIPALLAVVHLLPLTTTPARCLGSPSLRCRPRTTACRANHPQTPHRHQPEACKGCAASTARGSRVQQVASARAPQCPPKVPGLHPVLRRLLCRQPLDW